MSKEDLMHLLIIMLMLPRLTQTRNGKREQLNPTGVNTRLILLDGDIKALNQIHHGEDLQLGNDLPFEMREGTQIRQTKVLD